MSATERLLFLDQTKSVVPFACGRHHQFSHSDLKHVGDPTGIAIEEGEFLYGLVRMLTPERVLETGTNIGVSASYIALALHDNGKGHLTTIEHDRTVFGIAKEKLAKMGFTDLVTVIHGKAMDYTPDGSLDLLWLDTELKQRYAELLKFYQHMAPGAVAAIHDLWNLDWKEFGGVPDELRNMLGDGRLRALTFETPHGVTLFQKRRENDYLVLPVTRLGR